MFWKLYERRPLFFIGVFLLAALLFTRQSMSQEAVREGVEFDVSSVKLTTLESSRARGGLHLSQDGLSVNRQSLKQLMSIAYTVPYFRIVGGPSWTETDKYDLVGKTTTRSTESQLLLMFRGTLQRRFKLSLHHELRQMRVYAMQVSKGGPKFRESPLEPGASTCAECRMLRATAAQIAELLSAVLSSPITDPATGAVTHNEDLPVIDQTGLKGLYDVAFRPKQDADIFSAIQEQLGLKLDARRLSVDCLVIDGAQKAAAN